MTDRPFLQGVKVLDFSRALAGPFCTMMLADLGADVVKVEPPPGGDEARSWGPPFVNGESTYFMSVNRNKRSIVLDLRKEEAREVARKLMSRSDVLVENFRAGTTKKLGIDYQSARAVNPEMIYCSISGFGQTGPYSGRAGYDIIAFALSGMMSITGEEGRPPVKMGVPVADIGAGMYASFAISSALYRRQATGLGEYIDVSLLEGQISWLTYQAGYYFATGKDPERMGSAHLTIAPYQAFRSSDDYFIVAAGNDEHWRKLCDAIGAGEMRDDPRFATNPDRVRNREELEKGLSAIFARDRAANWVGRISAAGVPSCVINPLSSVFSDPQVESRGVVMDVRHPKAGATKQLNLPYRFDNYRFSVRSPPPALGADTDDVLRGIGYSAEEVGRLKGAGAVL
ncbi:MAG: CoA transferase [Nitrososphaerota archaeon]|nr:CoA transferase [Nitrososphaerota archaeon]MDG6939167.1 CoA transferase [Nitrososphaerota archaeon]